MSLVISHTPHPLRHVLAALVVLILLGGGYFLVLTISPYMPLYIQLAKDSTITEQSIPSTKTEDRLFIPRIGVDIAYQPGTERVLNNGAWHRYPERGNPEMGGNFILAGHRFWLAPTPAATMRQSPFFGVNHLENGDTIIVDYDQRRYRYGITKHYSVPPDRISIENPSKEAKLTLYTCTLGGEFDGREVIEARLLH